MAQERKGATLANRAAHQQDHACWTRRDFLARLGMATVGSALFCGNTEVQAVQSGSPLAKLAALEGDRTLVLVQLAGGNDGLNTVVPYENDVYYNLRPTIAIPKDRVIPLNSEVGLHPGMSPLQEMWDEGRMAVIQNVGYPDPNLSHFRSTDIWMSASDSEDYVDTGWGGRYLDRFEEGLDPEEKRPLAVQIGGSSPLIFQGNQADLSITMSDLNTFDRLTEDGLFPVEQLPSNTVGREMAFVRQVANSSFAFADTVRSAAEKGNNALSFSGGSLGRNLAVVSRLIKGDLGAKIYLVRLGGFDTHSGQAGGHNNLLNTLASSVRDFYADLALDNRSSGVAVMTFSEFGRRVHENGSRGTDHGTAAPVFAFGDGINGGVYGEAPDLDNLVRGRNLAYKIDFRQLYNTLFQDWFGLSTAETNGILGREYEQMRFVNAAVTASAAGTGATPFTPRLSQNYPNPFNPSTQIDYTLPRDSKVVLKVHNSAGQKVIELVNGVQAAGDYSVTFDGLGLSSGTYIYRLEAGEFVQTRKMTLMK